MKRALFLLVLVASTAGAEPPNAILLVAKPGLSDPNFSETAVLVTQTADFHTVGVILNRPTEKRHEKTNEPIYFGGPVLANTIVALYRPQQPPAAPAFHVLNGVYLTMHPANIEALLARRREPYRLYAGFSGWAPRQLEAELARDGWYVLGPSEELVFRKDTSAMWNELMLKARGARAQLKMGTDPIYFLTPANEKPRVSGAWDSPDAPGCAAITAPRCLERAHRVLFHGSIDALPELVARNHALRAPLPK